MLYDVINNINLFDEHLRKFNNLQPIMVEMMRPLVETHNTNIPTEWIRSKIESNTITSIPKLSFMSLLLMFEKHITGKNFNTYTKLLNSFVNITKLKLDLASEKIINDAGVYKKYNQIKNLNVLELQEKVEGLKIVNKYRYCEEDHLLKLIFDHFKDEVLKDVKKHSMITKQIRSILRMNDSLFIQTIKEDFKSLIVYHTDNIRYELKTKEREMKKIRKNLILCLQNQWDSIPVNSRPDRKIRRCPNSKLIDLGHRIVKKYQVKMQQIHM